MFNVFLKICFKRWADSQHQKFCILPQQYDTVLAKQEFKFGTWLSTAAINKNES